MSEQLTGARALDEVLVGASSLGLMAPPRKTTLPGEKSTAGRRTERSLGEEASCSQDP